MFDIPADKQGKIYFDEREGLPGGLDFDDTARGESVVAPEAYSICAYGRTLKPFKCSQGAVLIDTKYLTPFDDDVTLYERSRASGMPYIAVKEGMLIAGIILPFEARSDLGEWLVNMGELVITSAENAQQGTVASEG